MGDVRQTGAEAIAAERQRQIDTEGYTREHDAEHPADQLMDAARAYVLSATGRWMGRDGALAAWPWSGSDGSFKPTTPRQDLVKAGALIAAAIDRLDTEVSR